MPFVAAWMNLEMITLSEISQTEKDNIISYHLQVDSKIGHKGTYLWPRNRIMDTEQSGGCQGGRELEEAWSGRLGLAHVSCYIQRMDKQHGPTIQHRELRAISYDKP